VKEVERSGRASFLRFVGHWHEVVIVFRLACEAAWRLTASTPTRPTALSYEVTRIGRRFFRLNDWHKASGRATWVNWQDLFSFCVDRYQLFGVHWLALDPLDHDPWFKSRRGNTMAASFVGRYQFVAAPTAFGLPRFIRRVRIRGVPGRQRRRRTSNQNRQEMIAWATKPMPKPVQQDACTLVAYTWPSG